LSCAGGERVFSVCYERRTHAQITRQVPARHLGSVVFIVCVQYSLKRIQSNR